jgi:hypothetical protein
MSNGTGGGGNAKLREQIRTLEGHLQEATDAYVQVCAVLYDVVLAALGLPDDAELEIPDDGDVLGLVRAHLASTREEA